jgi:hypothetical protein
LHTRGRTRDDPGEVEPEIASQYVELVPAELEPERLYAEIASEHERTVDAVLQTLESRTCSSGNRCYDDRSSCVIRTSIR